MRTAVPVDLDLRVRTVRAGGRETFEYSFSSPSGAVTSGLGRIRGKPFRVQPEEYWNGLVEQIERWHMGLDRDGRWLPASKVESELVSLGRRLYDDLVPAEMRVLYRRIRDRIETIRITTDDPFVPWELLKPYDDDDAPIVDDDFLCLRFQVTRWLPEAPAPSLSIAADQVACFAVSEPPPGHDELAPLPFVARERELFASLGESHGMADATPTAPTFEALRKLLEQGGSGILHFSAHGDFTSGRPDAAEILLADGPVRPSLLSGPPRVHLRRDRPLVFLNVCRGARQGWFLTGLGGWAHAWVSDAGCGAFVGAQWTIRDDLACEFAETFYRDLASGGSFGEASRKARRRLRRMAPGDPTWLAYRVFADPNGRLVLG